MMKRLEKKMKYIGYTLLFAFGFGLLGLVLGVLHNTVPLTQGFFGSGICFILMLFVSNIIDKIEEKEND
jgi:hypothetical protein